MSASNDRPNRIPPACHARLMALAVGCLVIAGVHRATAAVGYETGIRNITNINADLVRALDNAKRRQVVPSMRLLAEVRLPCLASHPGANGTSSGGPACVSAGFVDFINRVAHARAIDESERGYFGRYTTQIAQQTRATIAPDFDTPPSKSAWDFQTMNRQASQFNQMVGGLLAIDLAHHYLGHYQKHALALAGDASLPMPVNAVITEQEWRDAVLRGARNALACGLGVEGLKTVFECFDQMPSRPAWAAYFIHPKANVAKMNVELARVEREFFAMNQAMQRPGPGGPSRAR